MIQRERAVQPRVRRQINMSELLSTLRPRQWTKNGIVFAALVFDQKLFQLDHLLTAVGAFICFSLASSAVYVVNDLQDVESDRQHPLKRHRPIAAGRIGSQTAWLLVAALLLLSLPAAFILDQGFGLVLVGYLLLMSAYTLGLKHLVLIDVFAISAGFVLRAAGGAVAIDVPISPWLYVCTILLSLFIAFGKRRHELLLLEETAGTHRRNLDEYSPTLLDQYILITAASTVMAYSLYTFDAPNLPDNHAMTLTIPFVVYAIFRYLYLIHRRDAGGSPDQVLFSDVPLLVCIVLWGVTSVIVLYTA